MKIKVVPVEAASACCTLRITYPVHDAFQVAVLGSRGPPVKVIGSQIRDNPESGDHDRRRSKEEEEEERRRSKIGKPTSWQHSRCMQGGVQLVAHRKLRCAHSNQGSLVAPHVQHQEQELHSNERKGTQSFLTKGSALLKAKMTGCTSIWRSLLKRPSGTNASPWKGESIPLGSRFLHAGFLSKTGSTVELRQS